MNDGHHHHAGMGNVGEQILDDLRGSPEPALVNDLTIYIERAVMAPDVAKVDADRDLNRALSAWDVSNEVLRGFSMGNSLLLLPRRACIPFPVTNHSRLQAAT